MTTSRMRPRPEKDNPHLLIPDWLAEDIPALYATDGSSDPVAWCKLFTPDSSFTWYVVEYSAVAPDGTPRLCFGLVEGLDTELGYFSLTDLEMVRGKLGLKVERDLYFTACPLSTLQEAQDDLPF
jgi:Protein of unknown function (DUF2958)